MAETLSQHSQSLSNGGEDPVNFEHDWLLAESDNKAWVAEILASSPGKIGKYATSVFANNLNFETVATLTLKSIGADLGIQPVDNQSMFRVYAPDKDRRLLAYLSRELREVYEWADRPFNRPLQRKDLTNPSFINPEELMLDKLPAEQQDESGLWMTGFLSSYLGAGIISYFDNKGKLLYPFNRYEEYAKAGHRPLGSDQFRAVVERIVNQTLEYNI